jgi:hypothetical protein
VLQVTHEQLGYLSGGIVSLAVAWAYFLTYFNPQRNALTRWVVSFVSREWVRGFGLSPKRQMLLLGSLAMVIGLVGVVLFMRSVL